MAKKVRKSVKAKGRGREKSAAVLTIFGAGRMTVRGRKIVAGWLQVQARALVRDGANYSERFRGRYLYRD